MPRGWLCAHLWKGSLCLHPCNIHFLGKKVILYSLLQSGLSTCIAGLNISLSYHVSFCPFQESSVCLYASTQWDFLAKNSMSMAVSRSALCSDVAGLQASLCSGALPCVPSFLCVVWSSCCSVVFSLWLLIINQKTMLAYTSPCFSVCTFFLLYSSA